MKVELSWLENWHVSNAVEADLQMLRKLAERSPAPEIDETIMHLQNALDKLNAARDTSRGHD